MARTGRAYDFRPMRIIGLHVLFVAYGLRAEPELLVPAGVRQGELLVVELRSKGLLTDGLVTLESPDGKMHSRIEAFPFPLAGGKFALAALIGISSESEPGTWTAKATGFENGFPFFLAAAFELGPKDFIHEDIPLDEANTRIRTRLDPRTEAEAKKLKDLLSKFDRFALYLDGPLEIPIREQRRTSTFGDRRTYLLWTGGSMLSVHAGIDIPGKRGSPVRAAGRGKVVLADERFLTGKSIVIEHLPGLFSLYYHLDAILVKTGETIDAGRAIGSLGSSGLSTGPHLHWEIRAGAVAVDPEGGSLLELPFHRGE